MRLLSILAIAFAAQGCLLSLECLPNICLNGQCVNPINAILSVLQLSIGTWLGIDVSALFTSSANCPSSGAVSIANQQWMTLSGAANLASCAIGSAGSISGAITVDTTSAVNLGSAVCNAQQGFLTLEENAQVALSACAVASSKVLMLAMKPAAGTPTKCSMSSVNLNAGSKLQVVGGNGDNAGKCEFPPTPAPVTCAPTAKVQACGDAKLKGCMKDAPLEISPATPTASNQCVVDQGDELNHEGEVSGSGTMWVKGRYNYGGSRCGAPTKVHNTGECNYKKKCQNHNLDNKGKVCFDHGSKGKPDDACSFNQVNSCDNGGQVVIKVPVAFANCPSAGTFMKYASCGVSGVPACSCKLQDINGAIITLSNTRASAEASVHGVANWGAQSLTWAYVHSRAYLAAKLNFNAATAFSTCNIFNTNQASTTIGDKTWLAICQKASAISLSSINIGSGSSTSALSCDSGAQVVVNTCTTAATDAYVAVGAAAQWTANTFNVNSGKCTVDLADAAGGAAGYAKCTALNLAANTQMRVCGTGHFEFPSSAGSVACHSTAKVVAAGRCNLKGHLNNAKLEISQLSAQAEAKACVAAGATLTHAGQIAGSGELIVSGTLQYSGSACTSALTAAQGGIVCLNQRVTGAACNIYGQLQVKAAAALSSFTSVGFQAGGSITYYLSTTFANAAASGTILTYTSLGVSGVPPCAVKLCDSTGATMSLTAQRGTGAASPGCAKWTGNSLVYTKGSLPVEDISGNNSEPVKASGHRSADISFGVAVALVAFALAARQ